MLSYEETMTLGQARYQDVLDALAAAGHLAAFTQTGGMNAALEVVLEGGWALLITDAEDSLSWDRATQEGWGVGLYAPDERYDGTLLAWSSTDDVDTSSLLALVEQVLLSAAKRG